MNELVRFALVALFPGDGDLPGLAELGVDDKITAIRRDSTPLFWLGLVGAALFFQLSPILTVRRPWPAVWLEPEQLDLHANRIATHPSYLIRQIMMLLKLVGGLFWGESPEIRAAMALPPYPADPGSRRTEPQIARVVLAERAPAPALVKLGRRETERGRGAPDLTHSITTGPQASPSAGAGAGAGAGPGAGTGKGSSPRRARRTDVEAG